MAAQPKNCNAKTMPTLTITIFATTADVHDKKWCLLKCDPKYLNGTNVYKQLRATWLLPGSTLHYKSWYVYCGPICFISRIRRKTVIIKWMNNSFSSKNVLANLLKTQQNISKVKHRHTNSKNIFELSATWKYPFQGVLSVQNCFY